MFKTALLGVITAPVAQACLSCDRGPQGDGEPRCSGFGPGCLGARRITAPATRVEDRAFRFKLAPRKN